MDEDMEAAVIAAETRRCGAMIANDPVALEALLDDRLHFSHATGMVDDKPGFLAKMASGRITYRSINWSEERVLSLGSDAALLTGRMLTAVRVETVDKQLDNRVMSAWARSGDAWRLVAFQSTPMKA